MDDLTNCDFVCLKCCCGSAASNTICMKLAGQHDLLLPVCFVGTSFFSSLKFVINNLPVLSKLDPIKEAQTTYRRCDEYHLHQTMMKNMNDLQVWNFFTEYARDFMSRGASTSNLILFGSGYWATNKRMIFNLKSPCNLTPRCLKIVSTLSKRMPLYISQFSLLVHYCLTAP